MSPEKGINGYGGGEICIHMDDGGRVKVGKSVHVRFSQPASPMKGTRLRICESLPPSLPPFIDINSSKEARKKDIKTSNANANAKIPPSIDRTLSRCILAMEPHHTVRQRPGYAARVVPPQAKPSKLCHVCGQHPKQRVPIRMPKPFLPSSPPLSSPFLP